MAINGSKHKIDILPEFDDPEAAEHRLATTYANDVAALQKYLKLPKPTRETWPVWANALRTLNWQGDQKISAKYHATDVEILYQLLSSSPENRINRQHISRLIGMINVGDFTRAHSLWCEIIFPQVPSTEANDEFYRLMDSLVGIPDD